MEQSTVIKDILFAVFIFPVTAGNITQGQRYPDGTIAAMVAAVVWLAIMHVLNQERIGKNINTEVQIPGVIHCFMSFNIILGLIGCVVFSSLTRLKEINSVSRFRGFVDARKLRIGFLWFFGIGTILHSLRTILKQVICMVADDGISYWTDIDIIADIVYNAVLCIFTITQICILQTFVSCKLNNTSKMHYCMWLMIGANASLWFHTFNKPIDKNGSWNISRNTTLVNYSSCLRNGSFGTNILKEFVFKTNLILRPTVLEFAILSVCLIFETWSPFKYSLLSNNTTQRGNIHADQTDRYNPEPEHDNIDTLIPASLKQSESRISLSSSYSFGVSLLIGSIIIVPIIVMCFLGFTIYRNDDEFHRIYRRCLSVYSLTVFVSIYYGFYALKRFMKPVKPRKDFHLSEITMLLTVFPVFQYYTYLFIAGVLSRILSQFIVISSFCLLSEYIQIVFILQAHRFEPFKFGPRNILYRVILVVMAVLSLGLWVLDGFVGAEYGFYNDIIEVIGHESWHHIRHTLFPIVVFYRFHVFFNYYSLYKNAVKWDNIVEV